MTVLLSSCGMSQNPESAQLVGGPCEGCEAVFEFGSKKLSPVDTLPGFDDQGLKIKVSGTVYQSDGITPAGGVVLYIYHTNQKGIYESRGDGPYWSKRHGYIRSWIKTDSDGKYAFYTLKPEVYPNRTTPAHIHITILEPNGKYYWIESCHFEGDELLTDKELNPEFPRGGIGLLSLEKKEEIWTGKRDIVLGQNIIDYN